MSQTVEGQLAQLQEQASTVVKTTTAMEPPIQFLLVITMRIVASAAVRAQHSVTCIHEHDSYQVYCSKQSFISD